MTATDEWSRADCARILRQIGYGAILALALIVSGRASAEVTAIAQNGFEVRNIARVAATPDKVYAALIAPARWWDSDHTFSGSAANLTLDAHAGGCWCETLPNGGSVLHLTVVFASPGKMLRLRGALGPFQSFGADGAMTWSLKPVEGGTDLTLVYALGGYNKDGFDAISKAADGVLSGQMQRLKQFVETGSP